MKIIDIHAHTEFSLEGLIKSRSSFGKLDLGKEKFLKDIKDLGVEYVFAIGKKDGRLRAFFNGSDDETADLSTLIEEKEKYPFLKRIIAINLAEGGNLNEIRKYLEKDIVSAVKVYLGYTTDAYNKLLKPYYDLTLEFDIPIYFHLGACFRFNATAHPSDVIPILEKYPRQRFVLCHLGHPLIKETAKIITEFSNAFTDLSGLMSFEDMCRGEKEPRLKRIKPVLKTLLENPKTRNKIMYGSDYPITQLKQYHDMIKEIIPNKMHDKIFYRNAKNFFRL